MKHTIHLEAWSLTQVTPGSGLSVDMEKALSGQRMPIGRPVTALEALIAAGEIGDSILEDGEAAYCEWVAEKDWLYTCEFSRPSAKGPIMLRFGGLDTDCEIWLNGAKIAEHHTMYLPLRLDITDRLSAQNRLAVYFHSPVKMYRWHEENMPEIWKNIVRPNAMMRKAPCDLFRNYLGVTPYFAPVGFFEDVTLELVDEAELTQTHCAVEMRYDLTAANVIFTAGVAGAAERAEVEFALENPDGQVVYVQRCPVRPDSDGTPSSSAAFTLDKPMLWWPRGYGRQPLCTAHFRLYVNGSLRDEAVRTVGFRRVELVGSLKFRINGTVIRMWGGNVGTMGTISHRWDPQKGCALLDKAEWCNFNTLRIWGPGDLLGDDFYDECDRRGIMVWQDFAIEPSQLPDTPQYMALFAAEAEHLVRRLRTHPCLMLWCGSNESMHMLDFHEETGRVGMEYLLTRVFPEICARLDFGRYYHTSCPTDGMYPNDPLFGDTHGHRCMMSYLPGEEYAVFFSEDIFTAPPELKSLRRFIPEKNIWPEGYADIASYGRENPFPPALRRRTNNFAETKLGPVERFYDATDAESLLYKYAAAAGYGYYDNITRLRRGKPAHDSAGPRRSNGHLVWKFNNTWPQFYCGLVDYYGECHIPYYDVRRALQPLLLTFDVGDHIYVWGVNDTPEDVAGVLTVRVFHLGQNRVIREMQCPVSSLAGHSSILTDLDGFGHFRRDSILYASLECDGQHVARAVGTVDMERHLAFPQAKLSLRTEGDALIISTDSFARCVELSGLTPDGENFGWHFEDNYFDLFPFETKAVRVFGGHKAGAITARAHYSAYAETVAWRAGEP